MPPPPPAFLRPIPSFLRPLLPALPPFLRAFPSLARALPAFLRTLLPALPSLLRALLPALPHLFLTALRRLVAPARCAACDAPASPTTVFCSSCAATVDPFPIVDIADRLYPLATTPTGTTDSAFAADDDPLANFDPLANLDPSIPAVLDIAFAPYGGPLATAVRRLKYGSRPDLARPLGHLLRRALRDAAPFLDTPPDLVVPVPLHPRKLRERGYNQAALLAAAAALELGRPLLARALRRTRDTPAQASLDRAARLENLANAFVARTPALVRRRHVLLVDDVCTTGTTLRACKRALEAAGAARITTLVLARADTHAPPEASAHPAQPVQP